MKTKKAVLGLDTAKLFVLAILALVIISVVTLIVLDSIDDVQPLDSIALSNVTTGVTLQDNGTGAYPDGLTALSTDCTLTVTFMTNMSSGTLIPATNYTVAGCLITNTGFSTHFNLSYWNVSGSYTAPSTSKTIVYNTSNAMASFFADAGTWFTLIGVVIIILIIAVVIVVVNRFGQGGGSFSAGSAQTANI